MEKFTELEKGTFVKNGKEYDYIVEIADSFPKKKVGNVRVKIIEERPVIRKIRTRYDPDITMYGDKNASMDLVLGYDMKEIKKAFRDFITAFIMPFYMIGITLAIIGILKIPKNTIPIWTAWILLPLSTILLIFGLYKLIRSYYGKFVLTQFAEYLKARDLKKILAKEGFKQ